MIVFFRGVNVGAHNRFQPAALAKELASLKIVNIGAAGTFVVRGNTSQAALRQQILRNLKFEPELMICTEKELLDLGTSQAFRQNLPKDVQRYVTVMSKLPKTVPALPLERPSGPKWQVRVIEISGRCALSLSRRGEGTLIYPNEVVEKHFGVSSTTRNWNTIEKIRDILQKS